MDKVYSFFSLWLRDIKNRIALLVKPAEMITMAKEFASGDKLGKIPDKNHDNGPHRSAEKFGRFMDDDELRLWGFVIESRPKYGPPIWKRNGHRFKHKEAIAEIPRLVEAFERHDE